MNHIWFKIRRLIAILSILWYPRDYAHCGKCGVPAWLFGWNTSRTTQNGHNLSLICDPCSKIVTEADMTVILSKWKEEARHDFRFLDKERFRELLDDLEATKW